MRIPLLLFGLPRSGTTWLGKIFDSHPDTLYWHEPDSVWRLPGPLLPDAQGLRDWLRRLQSSAPLKSQAKPPFFPKHYFGASRFQLHRLLILAAGAWSRLASAPAIPFLVFKNPPSSAERWREEPEQESIRLIMAVAGDSAPGQLYKETP